MSKGLFRRQAAEAAAHPESLGETLSVTRPVTWLLLAVLVLGMTAAIVWSLVVRVPLTVAGQGTVLGGDNRLTTSVAAEYRGRLVRVLVKVGDQVKVGQVVAHMARDDLTEKLTLARANLANLNDKLRRIRALQRDTAGKEAKVNAALRQDLKETIGHLNDKLKWLRTKVEGERKLLGRGFMSKVQFAKSQADLAAAEEALASKRTELKRLAAKEVAAQAARQKERLTVETEIAAASRQVSDLSSQIKQSVNVVSRVSGRVSEIDVAAGAVVQPGVSIVRLASEDAAIKGPSEAVIYIPLKDAGKVRPGMTVRLQIGSVRRAEFGSLRAKVVRVERIATSRAALRRVLNNNQLIRSILARGVVVAVHVALIRDPTTPSGYAWTSGQGPKTKVVPGAFLTAEITTERRLVAALVIPALK